jgi:hypothetical protein
MKNFFLILMMVLMAGFGYGTQPLRKPFIQIMIDGKPFKSGDILTVKPAQKLMIGVEMEGGRRDYCKFPDIYADIAGTAQILSRGENGITYEINGEKAEWKLISEEPIFTVDKYLKVKTVNNKSTAEVIVSNDKFSQTFLKIAINASWQFNQNVKISHEENSAEETIYFKVAGESDVWFSTKNIKATGIRNELVQEKLKDVQSACDSIETNFYRLNFIAVQQSIRNLQNVVSILKSTIDEIKTSNPSYQAKIVFIGLPSDIPYNDIGVFSEIKSSWGTMETMLTGLKERLEKLPVEPTRESNDELIKITLEYVDWQQKLPENTFKILTRYIPGINEENIEVRENIKSVAIGKKVIDYPHTLNEFNVFIDQRIEQLPGEIQRINSTQARIQAVKLFDGMLRSYVSSIYWAEWKNTRE